MKYDLESFLNALTLQGPTGKIKLTETMLSKCIIDANKTIVVFAASIGVDFESIVAGQRVTVEGRYDCDGQPCKVCFYRTKARGDKRCSISGIKKRAAVGDTIAITHDINGALVINASKVSNGSCKI